MPIGKGIGTLTLAYLDQESIYNINSLWSHKHNAEKNNAIWLIEDFKAHLGIFFRGSSLHAFKMQRQLINVFIPCWQKENSQVMKSARRF